MLERIWKNNWPLLVWAALLHIVIFFSLLFINPEIQIGEWWEHLIGCFGIFLLLKIEQFWNKRTQQDK